MPELMWFNDLACHVYGSTSAKRLVVMIHGQGVLFHNQGRYYPTICKGWGEQIGSRDICAIALFRPGYSDGTTMSKPAGADGDGRDNLTPENMDRVAQALAAIKARFKPVRFVLMGHSGGGGVAVIMLGWDRDLVDRAVVTSAMGDTSKFHGWTRSMNPLVSASKAVVRGKRIAAFHGAADKVVYPQNAKRCIDALAKAGCRASFTEIPEGTHMDTFRTLPQAVIRAVTGMMKLTD